MLRPLLRLLAPSLACLLLAACASRPTAPSKNPGDGLFAEITTPRGVIVCELFFEQMPLTVSNFVGLAEGTLGPTPRKPFYNGITFHRVVPGFVIQGGDPTGTGRGDPGYKFPDEFAAGLRHDLPGMLSMANSGPDTNGSQFFITLGEARYLDFNHAIFGRVVRGDDIPAQIQVGDKMDVKIVRRGAAAERFRPDEQSFAALLARASRARPPHLIDRSNLNPTGPESFHVKYLENRLSNLARFTGRHLYVRLFSSFEPDHEGQTSAQFAQKLLADLHAPAGTILACHFVAENEWVLAGHPPTVTLPTPKPPKPPRTPATTPEAIARQKQSQLFNATGDIVSGLIDQTDPK